MNAALLSDKVFSKDSDRWRDEHSFEVVQLCQALAESRDGSMDSGGRNPHRDLEQNSPCRLPAELKNHIAECMTRICARDRPISIPWAMGAKACIFTMDGHEHRVSILHLFSKTQKMRDETIAYLEEERTVRYPTRAEVDFIAFV